MSSAVANPARALPFRQADPGLRKFLGYSFILHFALALFIAVSMYLQLRGDQWGGVGGLSGATSVTLAPAAGIPMFSKPSPNETKAVDPTKGIWKEDPKPLPKPELKPPEPKAPAEAIAPFKHERPLPPSPKSRVDVSKIKPPDNAVNYGKGGSPQLPTSFATQPGAGSGAVAMQGQGGGDFALRYAWYVEAVRRRISQTWLQSTIDPAVRAARTARCVMTFRIYRDGSAKNIQLQQSSGNLSMDNSARRALDGIQFQPLPSDYSASYVDVTFDFDLSLNH